jgi:hypothetical protein
MVKSFEQAVSKDESVEINKAQTGLLADSVIASLSDYQPPGVTQAGQLWPPPIACRSWNNQTPPDAIHYSKEEVREILKVVYGLGIEGGEILVGEFRNGLPALLWGKVFRKVVSFTQKSLDHEPIEDSNQTILFGHPADTKFLYKAMEHLSNLKAILLDDIYYGNIISPYFMFRKLINPPGIIMFMNTAQRVPEHAGVHRFLKDLRAGLLDNTKHTIVHLHDDPKGYGISYELIS